ncbi:plasma-membrane proton-efflux P-type ATPase [Methanoregula sp.]|uniref:plasma-membrane proton-efflux P-type ATPase n=1 Tax=Methanoregula sp. TaxID=2052170 RepID=UPI003BAEF255
MPEEKGRKESKAGYQNMGIDELVEALKADVKNGLSAADIGKRVNNYGYNEVPEEKTNPYLNFAKKFWGPTAWMLEAVIVLSLILGNYPDVYVIVALLLLNAVLGFFQEQRASGAVDALKQKLRVNARTLRDGKWQMIPARELVPGDIVRIRAGDFVPADVKVLDGQLDVDQSALTGESLTVSKEKSDMLFSGSIIKSGESDALVVLTGNKTYFGKTTELVQFARPRLHSEKVISRIVTWLLVIVGVALAVAFVVSALVGIKLLTIVPLALVLLASSIPVALPAMFTITMAIGSMDLARRGVLVTRLSAAEDAATMDTLCSDKTGTITMNKLSVAGIIPMNGLGETDVLMYGALASEEANHDPIDLAFISAASDRNVLIEGFTRKSFIPFDPKTRRTGAVVERGKKTFNVVKGAVNIIADLVDADVNALNLQTSEYASKGYRTLAVAMGEDDKSLKIVGLVALYDIPRPDAKKLIGELKALGISVKMLTGDALPIAKETARQVGLSDAITTSKEFEKALETDPDKASEIAQKSDGFAEIYPHDKYSIVRSLQRQGCIVGMTGDGINDAPSLKQAEVGIAVSSATDVAKGAASVVLTGDGLGNIVDLVRVGRMIHQRTLTWIFNKVVKTFQIVVFVVVAFLLTGQFIVSVFDVVLLLFVIDFVTLSISTDNVRGSMKPDTWDLSGIVKSSLILGVLVVLESLAILFIGLGPLGLAKDSASIQTFAFAILFYFGMLTVFVVRERGHFWNSFPSKSLFSITLLDMIAVAFLLTVGIPGLKPLPIVDTLTIVGMSVFFCFAVNDFIKYFMLKPKNEKS